MAVGQRSGYTFRHDCLLRHLRVSRSRTGCVGGRRPVSKGLRLVVNGTGDGPEPSTSHWKYGGESGTRLPPFL